ncbi:SH3 domain-containing C40 family peptidase [uncultured Anaerococcus sp.]|uniref:C40 family peptidase n=1 Tax=uncultured Anaerococcus sp. TaxID=293428 RepID=UPI0025FC29A1|nr:SH3 domain-containing C40 family peptidase [uncultured Anaerococcus sp.]
MSKKNIGAALSVMAASAVVATAYATTVSDLENDKHTNSLITEENKDVDSSYSFLKSDYTKEVKNTKIAGKKRDSKKASQEIQRDIVIEKTAKTLVKKKIIEAEKEAKEKETQEANEKAEEELVSYDDKDLYDVVKYDDEDLDQSIEELNQEKQVDQVEQNEQVEVEEQKEQVGQKSQDNEAKIAKKTEANLVSYDDEEIKPATYEEGVSEDTQVLNEEENEEEVVLAEEEAVEDEEAKAPLISDKFVNTASLNIRTTKDATNNANIVRSIKAGDKLQGYVEGEWFVTNEGYVHNSYLVNYYPQDLVEKIEQEAKQAEIARLEEERRLAEERRKAEEAKQAEEARKAEEAKQAEEARKAEERRLEEERRAQEQQAQQEVVEVEQVVEEQAINTPQQSNQSGQAAANIASQFVGLPYVWGSSNPNVGFDCSGLTSYAYRQMGITIPHSSAAQFNSGYAVDVNNLKAGDLVFFSFGGGRIDHVGIMLSSDGSFVHASTPSTGVRYDNIFNSAYQNAYRGARRIY